MKMKSLCFALLAATFALSAACEKKAQPAKPAGGANAAKADDHGHEHAAGESHDDHDHDHDHEGDHGEPIALGEGMFGPFKVRASRDGVEFKPGGDAPIDAWVDGAAAESPKVVAVRFWIGLEDAKVSIKAKADIEDPAQPNRWHTHAEVPSPLPEGSKLWVEIEDDKGGKTLAGFDLKT
jgi:hypothetical protein